MFVTPEWKTDSKFGTSKKNGVNILIQDTTIEAASTSTTYFSMEAHDKSEWYVKLKIFDYWLKFKFFDKNFDSKS